MPITTSLFAFAALGLRAAASFNEHEHEDDWGEEGIIRSSIVLVLVLVLVLDLDLDG
jgi:hypothetical protein